MGGLRAAGERPLVAAPGRQGARLDGPTALPQRFLLRFQAACDLLGVRPLVIVFLSERFLFLGPGVAVLLCMFKMCISCFGDVAALFANIFHLIIYASADHICPGRPYMPAAH